MTAEPGRLLIRGGLVLASGRSDPAVRDVLIEGSTIAAVAPSIPPSDDGAGDLEVMDAAGHLVIPGLVNAHTHGRENLVKGLVDNRPLEEWLHEVALHSSTRTPREQYVSVALGAVEALRSGTTSMYELFTNIPVITPETVLAVLEAYRDVGVRALVAPSISDLSYHRTIPGLIERLTPARLRDLDTLFPPRDGASLLDAVEAVEAAWLDPRGRVRLGVAPVIPERCSDALIEAACALADRRRLPLHTHLAETRVQVAERFRRSGDTPVRHLARLGALGTNVTVAHAVWVDDLDIDTIAESGATVVHNPTSNLKLGSGVMPLAAMLGAGVPVAVGTDGSASSDNQNMFEALRLATYVHRSGEPDWERWPTAHDVLASSWESGARAMGRAGELGRLEPGFLADVTVLDCDVESLTPLNDARNQLVMCETGAAVRHVVVDGEVVLRDGEPVRIDARSLRAEARAAAERSRRAPDRLVATVADVTAQIRHARFELFDAARSTSGAR